MEKPMSKLTFFRLVLSGALAGIALFGVIAPAFGIETTSAKDAVSAAVGAAVVAIGFKLAHFA